MDLQSLARLAHGFDCKSSCGHADRIPALWVELLGARVERQQLAVPAQRVAA